MKITEDQLEQICLDWFTSQGYRYKNGYDIAPDGDSPERDDYPDFCSAMMCCANAFR